MVLIAQTVRIGTQGSRFCSAFDHHSPLSHGLALTYMREPNFIIP